MLVSGIVTKNCDIYLEIELNEKSHNNVKVSFSNLSELELPEHST